ncbi:MAG: tetratricopeptide repeat protein [Bacteroidota bacterium]
MKLLLSLFFLISSLFLSAQDYNEQFLAANTAYRNGQYASALEQYENIVAAGQQSAALYYNIANSYYQQNTLGKAILYYERALELAPQDEDVQHNLSLARTDLKDEIEALPPFFLAAWWATLRKQFGSSTWAWCGLVLLWLAVLGGIIWQLGKTRAQRKGGFTLGTVLLVVSILPFSLAYSKAKAETHSGKAIVLAKEVTLRYAPEAESTAVVDIHEGTKLELLDQISTWYKVQLANGEQGWLPTGTFEEI